MSFFSQLYSLCGKKIVGVSAGKYWNAAVTSAGDIYMWDGKKAKDQLPALTRLHGTKRATKVAVGETHLLLVGSIYHPPYPVNTIMDSQKSNLKVNSNELGELDEGFMFNDMESESDASTLQKKDVTNNLAPSLKSLCEKVAAECLMEPRTALQMLEIAESLGADDLRRHCEVCSLSNYTIGLMVISSQ